MDIWSSFFSQFNRSHRSPVLTWRTELQYLFTSASAWEHSWPQVFFLDNSWPQANCLQMHGTPDECLTIGVVLSFCTCLKVASLKSRCAFISGRREYNRSTMVAACTYMLFETHGIPCRHIIPVLRSARINELPSYYLLERFTQGCKKTPVFDVDGTLLEENNSNRNDLETQKQSVATLWKNLSCNLSNHLLLCVC